MSGTIPVGDYGPLTKRKLTEESCRKWGYSQSRVKHSIFGEDFPDSIVPVQVANYRDPQTGELIAQKLRDIDKNMVMVGAGKKKPPLYGQHLWRDGGKRIVITEGEIDAISISQLQDHRWPVVSVPTGAKGAKKAIERHLGWLDKFKEVILAFDNDEEGQAAVAQCAPLFAPGKCKVARFPLKDANEMLVAGRGEEVLSLLWEAKTYRPDGIVTIADIRARVLAKPEMGLPWWMAELNALTRGRHYGKIYSLGAGTGVGKTDLLTQQMEYDIAVLGLPIGVFALEQPPEETVKRIAGKFAKKRFHIDGDGWTEKELEETVDEIEGGGKLFMYDNYGAMEWDIIRSTIRFLVHSEGVRIFYIDNLTALAAMADNEKEMLQKTMAEIAALANELKIVIHLVSHLSTPEGDPHEEGGRVKIRHFKGSRAIGFWCHYIFGLERNTQAEDPQEQTRARFRILKDRDTHATGKVIHLDYDAATATMFETSAPSETSDKYGFKKEEDGAGEF